MKTLSFFISSTFRDMDFERDCLNKIVVPKLQEYYLRYGYFIRFFDLRWGVTVNNEDLEEREKKILRTCFDAIDDCKPFFIALLGHRYGWIPEKSLYLSSNKLQGNIYEQIGIDNPSVTAMEIAYGIFEKQSYNRSLVFIRNQSSYENIKDLEQYVEYDPQMTKYAEQLKDTIKRLFSEHNCDNHVIQYTANLNKPSESRFKVVSLFEEEIRKCVNNYIKIDSNSELNIYEILSEQTLFHYVRPQSCTDIIKSVLNNESAIIYGDEGSGKTSLSFLISKELKRKGNIVLYHSVGYSDISFDPHEMIWKWTCEFKDYDLWVGDTIQKLDSIEKEWKRLCYLNSVVPKQFTIIIDSIDRMLDNFSSSNLMIALPSDIQFIIFSKEKLPNWDLIPETKSFKLEGVNKDEARDIINETCRFHGKDLSPQLVDKILSKRCIGCHFYSPLDILTILDFLLGMDAEDFKQIRNNEGSSEEEKMNNYMTSFIDDIPVESNEMYNRILRDIEYIYGLKSIIPLKVLSLSRNGLDEDKLHHILKQDYDLLEFTLVRQLLHHSLTDNFASKAWYFKQETVRRALLNYESPLLPSNEYYLKIMSEAPCLNEERIYYAVLIQNNVALLQCLATYDDATIIQELIKAKYETSLIHILECLKKCLTNDEIMIEKIFGLLIFKLQLQSFDEKIEDRIYYWKAILDELDKKYSMKRERILFLKARANEMLGDVYKACNDIENAENCYLQAACYLHILDMKNEKEKCRMKLLNLIK